MRLSDSKLSAQIIHAIFFPLLLGLKGFSKLKNYSVVLMCLYFLFTVHRSGYVTRPGPCYFKCNLEYDQTM